MKPLPLVDGAFLIDNSGLEKLRCPRMFEYSEIERKSPVAERAGANFGSAIHRGLETRYNIRGNEEVDTYAHQSIEIAMFKWLEQNPQPNMDFRNFNHACKMMRVYNNIYKKEAFEIVKSPTGKQIIEASFVIPIGLAFLPGTDVNWQVVPWNGQEWEYGTTRKMSLEWHWIYYSGKIDLGIKDHNGIWSFDHKTTFQFGDTFDKQMAMDGGQLGYCWALGQTLGIKPQGYIIDAIRVRRPKKQDEFGGIDCIDATDFKRTPYYVTEDMLEEWRKDTLTLVKNVFDYHSSGHFPRHRWNCTNKFGMCDFYDVCSTPRAQREQILQSGLFEENTWTAGLKTNEEKKG
jgi:PD-(D/E)XK nuclease superfamily